MTQADVLERRQLVEPRRDDRSPGDVRPRAVPGERIAGRPRRRGGRRRTRRGRTRSTPRGSRQRRPTSARKPPGRLARSFLTRANARTIGDTDGSIIAAIIVTQIPTNQPSPPRSVPGPASIPRMRSTVTIQETSAAREERRRCRRGSDAAASAVGFSRGNRHRQQLQLCDPDYARRREPCRAILASRSGDARPAASRFRGASARSDLFVRVPVVSFPGGHDRARHPADLGAAHVYRGQRVGRGGRIFTMTKFSTLRIGAEKRLGHHLRRGARRADREGGDHMGRWLRATQLDEIPQFWNVLKGDMSLVGPRPIRPRFFEELAEELPAYWQRLVVSPGLTGSPRYAEATRPRWWRSSPTTSSGSRTARTALPPHARGDRLAPLFGRLTHTSSRDPRDPGRAGPVS